LILKGGADLRVGAIEGQDKKRRRVKAKSLTWYRPACRRREDCLPT
jgi:hypothetical protein